MSIYSSVIHHFLSYTTTSFQYWTVKLMTQMTEALKKKMGVSQFVFIYFVNLGFSFVLQ